MQYPKVKLGDAFETSAGGTPLKSHNEYYDNGTIPWLRSGEVCQKNITSTELFITKDGLSNSSAKLFPINTVLVAMYGATAGQVGILRIEATTNQAVCGILPGNYIPEYLYYQLIYLKDFLVSQAVGGAQPNVSQEKIKNLEIQFPSVPIQQEIVARLEKELAKVDEMAESFKRMAELADEEFQSVLAETFEHVEGKSVQLGDVCDIKAGGDKPFPFSTTLNDSYNIPVIANAIEKDGLCGYTDKPTIVQKCITVSARGTIGYTCVRDYPFVPIIRLLVVTPRKDIDVQYLCYFLQTQKINSTGVSIPQLTAPMLRQIKYIDVEKGQQEIIVKKINNAKVHHDILYDNAKKCLSLCSELRKSILQEAFS